MVRATRRVLIVLAVGHAAIGCATSGWPKPTGLATPPETASQWKTLAAEHRVTVWTEGRDGEVTSRRFRGLFVAKRPDRFRVRLLGPGDSTLADVMASATRCEPLTRPSGATRLDELLPLVCDDLRAAFRLDGPAPTAAREVRYDDLRQVAGRRLPFVIWIRNPGRRYLVKIETRTVAIDEDVASAFEP